MAKLYFYYAAMNAGKSTALLQSAFNYTERGMKTLCFLPQVAANFSPTIRSRIGIETQPVAISAAMNIKTYVETICNTEVISCILVDEAQFLQKEHVEQLCAIVDQLDIPVLAYGLRTDFLGELFPGSHYLLSWADVLQEIKTVCFCGRKAIMTARKNAQGAVEKRGEQVQCGGNDIYVSLCRKHYHES